MFLASGFRYLGITLVFCFRKRSKSTTTITSQMISGDLEASPLLVDQQQQQTQQVVSSGGGIRKINLPEDIIQNEILTRVPAKSLSILRLVCKSWKVLFSTSKFVKSHLTRQHYYKDQDLLIGLKQRPGVGPIIISSSCEINLTTAVPFISDVLLGSIKGLVCMASEEEDEICVWNPALGQLKEVYLQSQHSMRSKHFLGFSWDHGQNDYKVVIVSDVWTPSSCQLSIYSSNSGSWTELVIPDFVLPDTSIFQSSLIKTPSTIVKGLPYWSYSNCLIMNGKKHKYISSFKFVAETNEIRLLPNLDTDTLGKKEFNLVNIKDCLVGIAYIGRYGDDFVDIYSLDVESHSGAWIRMYSSGPINSRMGSVWLSQCFKNGGEILVVGYAHSSLWAYDLETGEAKCLNTTRCSLEKCFSYTPSLVCVQGMEPMQFPKNGYLVERA